MDACRISRIRNRYRLPGSLRQEQRRLDRICSVALADMLEIALELVGVPVHEEICIRDVRATLRLGLSRSDSDLAVVWSLALAEALAETIRERRPGVVRYSSRHHALVDVLTSVATGDTSRAWAWHQLGLWSGGGRLQGAATVDDALLILAREAHAAPAVLAQVARNGLLAALFRAPRAESWQHVARAALEAVGVSPSLAVPDAAAPPPASALAPKARRILCGSRIIGGATAVIDFERADPRLLRSLAVLGTLETDPGALLAGELAARALLALVEYSLLAGRRDNRPGITPAGARLPERPADSGTPPPVVAPPDVPSAPAGDMPSATAQGDKRGGDHWALASRGAEPASTPVAPVPEVRRRATTLAGGLLFLLHLVAELGLPQEILASETLNPRALRWVLHRLALALVPLELDDPAALAFAGLMPEDEPPSRHEPQPTEAELVAIDSMRARLSEALWVRVGCPDEAREVLLCRVCRRRAEVAGDPAWIEVRLFLDEVSLEVRRAALDLDLGWLPWLGVVVRFVYA